MKHDPKVCFLDVLNACQQILNFSENMTFEEYSSNDLVKSAVERKFEIIGEALNRVKKIDVTQLESVADFEQIIGFRNVIAHGYDSISDRIVWDAINDSIPMLIKEINDKINE
ncbi:MAG: HepT-like ribonuclease domain-containing protein [Desulfobacterales bacterium]